MMEVPEMVIRGKNCPLKEDQEEQHEDRKDDLCLHDLEVTQIETQARKLG